MGTAERDYTRGGNDSRPGFLARLSPVVKWLLILNVGIALLDFLFFGGRLADAGAFSIRKSLLGGHVWQLLTFQFLHANLGHILFNSMAIYFFGPWLERQWGASKFLVFYLLCGMGGAVFFTLLVYLNLLPGSFVAHLVGASAGIYGLLVATAVLAPEQRVRLLFPPVELSMRQLALGLIGISVVMILFRLGGNEGGEAGHLGGAILGFFLTRHPRLLAWAEGSHEVKVIRPKAFKRRSEAKIKPRSKVDFATSTEVDRILDKISRDGFQSLTQAERDVLKKASESHQPKS